MMFRLGLEFTKRGNPALFVKFNPRNTIETIHNAITLSSEVPFYTYGISAYKHVFRFECEIIKI